MIYIARFVRAFFYFWVFGIISILLDLDHIIQVYQDGLELNLGNLAYHGTRTLHIPILILSGCFCIFTAALLTRFWNLNKHYYLDDQNLQNYNLNIDSNLNDQISPSVMLNIASSAIITQQLPVFKPGKLLIECPSCLEYFSVITTKKYTELLCPHCGVKGYFESKKT